MINSEAGQAAWLAQLHLFAQRRTNAISTLEPEPSSFSSRIENVLDTFHVKDIDVLHASGDELLT